MTAPVRQTRRRGKLFVLAAYLAWLTPIIIGTIVSSLILAYCALENLLGLLAPNGPGPMPPMRWMLLWLSLGWVAFGVAAFYASRLPIGTRRAEPRDLRSLPKLLVTILVTVAFVDVAVTVAFGCLEWKSMALIRVSDHHYDIADRISPKPIDHIPAQWQEDPRARYHRGLGDKYQRAALYPFLPVAPDPPPPR
jgi:hypothetical protein